MQKNTASDESGRVRHRIKIKTKTQTQQKTGFNAGLRFSSQNNGHCPGT